MDMTSEYLKGCSPYIDRLVYDIGKRQLLLVCVDSPETCKPVIEIIFTGIEFYKEETLDDEYDDQCIDSVLGINWVHENTICIHTEKKEIVIKFDGNYVRNSIA